ncbi:MAG: DUF4389 domain-containing protein, partial [Microcella sp.]|nr:DUF4389 domain-containing protein [Microcella sp.]
MSETPTVQTSAPPRRGGWLTMIIIGSLITALAGTQLIAAAALATVVAVGGSDGFVSAPAARVATPSSAITTPSIDLDSSLDNAATPDVRIAVTAGRDGDDPVFVGIGSSDAVADYLEGVAIAELGAVRGYPPRIEIREVPGGTAAESPDAQAFWVASESGPGAQTVTWVLEPGDWTFVIMNADGSPGIDSTLRIGVEAPWAAPVAVAFAIASAVSLLIGLALLIAGLFGWGRGRSVATEPMTGPYPVAVTGHLDPAVSRWLWIVKWILVIPHWVVLSVLWVGFVVATVIAFFGILFTGRYPRSLFPYTTGVLRYTWRVAFYAYSALGTDRYPPFSLTRTDYPADVEIAYPERLNNGLVLVKGWLLAIPHLAIVGVLLGGSTWTLSSPWGHGTSAGTSASLLGLL